MKLWLKALLDACFPPICPFCDEIFTPDAHAVCPTCRDATQWLGHPLTVAHFPEPAWDSVRAVCRFDGPIMEALHRFKYGQRTDLAPALGRMLIAQALATGPHDAVIPVPLSAGRLRHRGYNQSQLLAYTIARALRVPLLRAAVRRVRETPPQVGLSAADRRTNVRAAFAVAAEHRAQIAGRRCLLIDDVMTTGATLHACATALRCAGARHIHGLIFAAVT